MPCLGASRTGFAPPLPLAYQRATVTAINEHEAINKMPWSNQGGGGLRVAAETVAGPGGKAAAEEAVISLPTSTKFCVAARIA